MNFKIYLVDDMNQPIKQINDKEFPIFKLEIIHKEATFPRLKILTCNPAEDIFNHRRILIYYDNKILFKGNLQALPMDINSELVTLCYLAQPKDYDSEVNRILQKIKKNNEIDPLSISQTHEALDVLEAIPVLIEWSRASGNASYCHLLGNNPIDVKDVFYDSLKITLSRKPYKAVEVNVHAHWMQQYQKVHDISEKLKQELPNGLISTLSGKNLQKNWWQRGEQCQGKHYYISKSSLKEYNPPPQQQEYFPVISKRYKDNKYFKRYWFEPEITLAWHYQQPRHEMLSFSINQGETMVPADTVKTINLTLNDIVGPKQTWQENSVYKKGQRTLFKGLVFSAIKNHISSTVFQPELWKQCTDYHTNKQAHLGEFFITKRGRKAAAYALKIAQTHLLASARALDIQFSCPLDQALDIDTTTTIRLRDKRIPGGVCFGKVKSCRFTVDGETGESIAFITISASVGKVDNDQLIKFRDYTNQRTSLGI